MVPSVIVSAVAIWDILVSAMLSPILRTGNNFEISDETRYFVIKHTVCTQIIIIMNICFESGGWFVTNLNYSKVGSSYKKWDYNGVNNFRVLTVVSLLPKIFEVALNTKITHSMINHNLMANLQPVEKKCYPLAFWFYLIR